MNAKLDSTHAMLARLSGLPAGGGLRPPAATAGAAAAGRRARPALAQTIAEEIHDNVLGHIGISLQRREAQDIRATLPVEMGTWWAAVSRLKGQEQWQRKIRALGCSSEDNNSMSTVDVGKMLYKFLTEDGDWSPVQIQEVPQF